MALGWQRVRKEAPFIIYEEAAFLPVHDHPGASSLIGDMSCDARHPLAFHILDLTFDA